MSGESKAGVASKGSKVRAVSFLYSKRKSDGFRTTHLIKEFDNNRHNEYTQCGLMVFNDVTQWEFSSMVELKKHITCGNCLRKYQ